MRGEVRGLLVLMLALAGATGCAVFEQPSDVRHARVMTKAEAASIAQKHMDDIVNAVRADVDPQWPSQPDFSACGGADGAPLKGPDFQFSRYVMLNLPADGSLAALGRIKSTLAAQGVRFTESGLSTATAVPSWELGGSWPGQGFGFYVMTGADGDRISVEITASCMRPPSGAPTADPPTATPVPGTPSA